MRLFLVGLNQLTMSIAEGGGGERAAAGTGTRRCCWGLGGGSGGGGLKPFGSEEADLWDMLNVELPRPQDATRQSVYSFALNHYGQLSLRARAPFRLSLLRTHPGRTRFF